MVFPELSGLRPLFLLSAALALGVAMLFLAMSRRKPRSPMLAFWGVGMLVAFAANVFYTLRGLAPDAVSIFLANALLFVALMLFRAGAARLNATPKSLDKPGIVVTVTTCALLAWLTFVSPDLEARILIVCMAVAFLAGRIATQLSLFAHKQGYPLPANVLAGLWWFVVAVMLITALATLVHGEPGQDLFQSGPPVGIMVHARPVLVALIAIFALWTQHHAHRADTADRQARLAAEVQASRAAFERLCDEAIAVGNSPLAVALIDMDDYHQLSRKHGPEAAQAVLAWVADTTRGRLRPGDRLESYGHDQLALLLPGTDRSEALLLLDEIRKSIHKGQCTHAGKTLTTTVSIGAAARQWNRSTGKALAAAAKVAVFQARAAGRNRVEAAADAAAPLLDLEQA